MTKAIESRLREQINKLKESNDKLRAERKHLKGIIEKLGKEIERLDHVEKAFHKALDRETQLLRDRRGDT